MKALTGLIVATSLAFAGAAEAQGRSIFEARYEVTVTNVTRGQYFTPMIVVTHSPGATLFELGAEPSPELADLAEGGATAGLADALDMSGAAFDIQHTDGGLIGPGESRTVVVDASLRGYNRLSLAGMLLPTNDTFAAINSLPLEFRHASVAYAMAYDAGSEDNDESCAHIPGPIECGGMGEPFSAGLGEGFVHVSAGIHGVGDLDPASYDWRSAVAKVKIVRID